MERINKIIASSGICSRRKAEELVKDGKVSVNGQIITDLATKVSNKDVVVVNGEKINTDYKVYYLLNKPRGVISSVSDDKNRKTLVDLIDEELRIYPIGRLDYDTTGIILLTNDGELSNILMHPRNEVPKTYLAKIEGIITMDEYFKIKKGVNIDGSIVVPKKLKILSKDLKTNTSKVKITVCEGKNHLIKKIFEKIHHPVIKLKREEYGFLNLYGLNSGDYRKLSTEEVESLYEYRK